MIKALLFDLDDTLLGNDMRTFIPAYFQRVAGHFPEADPNRLLAELMRGTQAMLANTDPTRSLREVFEANFDAGLDGEVWQRFENFYLSDFAQLQTLTKPRPIARDVLNWALASGYGVVLATNALFPLTAIRERLRWAGLADLPFELITHIENSHFAKPNPEYFAEILARLGVRPREALMVGNDWNDDIAPAAALGLATWWLAPAGTLPPSGNVQPVGVGELSDFWAWAQAELANFTPPEPPPMRIPYRLAGNLAYLLGELSALSATEWKTRPAPGEWSLTEIVCHFRDVEAEVNLPRTRLILETDNPFLSGAVTDPWAVERNYQAQDGPQALRDFAVARQSLIRLLKAQPESAWARAARHAILGPTTLAELLTITLDHDRLHLEQVRATLRRLRNH
jgi:FMN phosphatase YigB (HAD superfamily)